MALRWFSRTPVLWAITLMTGSLFLASCTGDAPVEPELEAVLDVDMDNPLSTVPAPPPAPRKALNTTQNPDGSVTYTQVVNSGGKFGQYVCYPYNSWGWTHTFPGYNTPGRNILSVTVDIYAYDVDAETWRGYNGEFDGIFMDGAWMNPQYLQGRNGAWVWTHFDAPVGKVIDDGVMNMWISIDMHNTYSWCTTLNQSVLKVTYADGEINNPPFQPVLQLVPQGPPSVNANLSVNVTGPDPVDPDEDAVTYEYRWFLKVNAAGFKDPEEQGRGSVPAPGLVVPASMTRVGDEWRVQVTPRDEHGAIGPYAVATFPPVIVGNQAPVPVIRLDCQPYFEGSDACINGGPTYDPDPNHDVSDLTFHWVYGDGETHTQQGVVGQPNHVYKDDGTYTVTLTVTDPEGASATTSARVTVANVAPTVTINPHPPLIPWGAPFHLGAAFTDPGVLDATWDWTIDWGNGDSAPGSASKPGPFGADTHYLTVGTYTVSACVTDKDGAQGCASTQVEVFDPTPPVVTYELVGDNGDNGWFIGPVTVDWTVEDPESAISATSGCDDPVVSADGAGHTATCSATSAGGTTVVTTDPFNIDQTAPVVTYTGNAGFYDVADHVTISCSATDATSGVADDTCADVTGEAWTFGLGLTSFSAWAVDNAGWETTTSGSFDVQASYGGVCSLVERWVSHNGVANSLCVKLNAAARAEARGRTNARDGSLGAFINEVEAQSGKKVPADKEPYLIRFAQALMMM